MTLRIPSRTAPTAAPKLATYQTNLRTPFPSTNPAKNEPKNEPTEPKPNLPHQCYLPKRTQNSLFLHQIPNPEPCRNPFQTPPNPPEIARKRRLGTDILNQT